MITTDEKNIKLKISITKVVNYSLQQNGIPTIRKITVVNERDEAITDAELIVSSTPAICHTLSRHIDYIPPSSSISLKDVSLLLNAEYMMSLTERQVGALHFTLKSGDEILYTEDMEITCLAFDEWHGSTYYPELLTAFVTPNHPEVSKIAAKASVYLKEWTGDPSLDDYQTKDPSRVLSQAAAVYSALCDCDLLYATTPASFNKVGQRVRLCDTVMRHKMGNCLDLTLLYASVLEAIGLNPLLILTEGHIFAGVWLEQITFPEAVQDDVSLITKRLANGVNEIAVVESTLFTSGKMATFDDAKKCAEGELLGEAPIEYIIDVKRARLSGTLPLPTRILTDSGWEIVDLPENHANTWTPPTALGKKYDTDSVVDEEEFPKMVLWERKLLDLGLRNQLINFRLTKKTIPLLIPSLDELENALADGKEYTVWAHPSDMDTAALIPDFEVLHNVEPIKALLQSEFKNQRLRSIYSDVEVKQIMKELYRSAKLSMEENGANTLYLAMGIMRWYETEKSSKALYAPLILVPIEIIRRSAALGYAIHLRDEESRINVTLLEKLKQDFDINVAGLDPLPADEHGIDIRYIFTTLRKAIMGQKRWDILESAYLGIFSFSQFVMWNDLRNRSEDLQKNKIVKSLIDGKLAWEAEEMTVGDKVPEGEVLLPLPADASQLFAIEAAAKGESFVLHGPPGTGKSQTITALIANSLAKGKTVLFVAEKMAALDVVRRRLQAIGIGDFCLELHSNRSKKKYVLDQLKRASEVNKTITAEQFATEADRIAELRHELDDYADALHSPRSCGMTLFELIDRYESVSDAEDILSFSPSAAESFTADDLSRQSLAVDRIVAAGQMVGHPRNHPFTPIKRKDYHQNLRAEIELSAKACKESLLALESKAIALGAKLELPANNLSDLNRIDTAISELVNWLDLPRSWTEAEEPNVFFPDICQMASGYALISSLKKESPDLMKAVDSYGEGLKKLSTSVINKLNAAEESARRLADALNTKAPVSRAELLRLCELSKELIVWSCLPAVWSRTDAPNRYFSDITSTARHYLTANEIREKYVDLFLDSFWSLDGNELASAYRSAMEKWALPRAVFLGKIAKGISVHARVKPDKTRLAEYIDDLCKYRAEMTSADETLKLYKDDLDAYYSADGYDWRAILRDAEIARGSMHKVTYELDALGILRKNAGSSLHVALMNEYVSSCDSLLTAMDELFSALGYVNVTALVDDLFNSLSSLCRDLTEHSVKVSTRNIWHALADIAEKGGLSASSADVEMLDNTLPEKLRRLLSSGETVSVRYPESLGALRAATLRDKLKTYFITKLSSDKLFESYSSCLEGLYNGESTDWEHIDALAGMAWASAARLYELTGSHKARHLAAEREEISPLMDSFTTVFDDFTVKYYQFSELLSLDNLSDSPEWFALHKTLLDALLTNIDSVKDWFAWNAVRSDAYSEGLGNVVDAYVDRLEHYQVASAYKKALYRVLASLAIDSSPTLNTFSGALFNEKVAKYKAIDQRLTALTRREIFCRLASNVPSLAKEGAKSSEAGILQRAIRSGGRGVSIRKLFEQLPNLLPKLAPCMLMSPLSAAQYLDPKREPFDIVVFDEASQMPTCKAVGALARGENAVIVGDPNQMPPTSFFATNALDEDNIDTEDLESILDDCLSLNMPGTHLLWHYRSRHESLIAFSNSRFYENKLFTFPSINDRESKVSLIRANGIFDRGKTRQNRAEAEMLVDELYRRCSDPELSKYSVGIVTFNVSQQNLIDDMISDLCSTDPEFEKWVYYSKEPLFIKNLENVQGDERDVILFSVGYGPDKDGKVFMNFGPLNRDGGWRRLNVAVSRARYEMMVFSSMDPEMIDLSKSSSEGVSALRAFLEYAKNRTLPVTEESATAVSTFEDGMIFAICDKLKSYGYTAESLVGHSEYRVDVAVIDPRDPDKYLLGILLDGASFKAAKTTRDRELSQISVLEGLGWNIIRIRALDWWDNSSREIARVLDEIGRIMSTSANERISEPEEDAFPELYGSDILGDTDDDQSEEAVPQKPTSEYMVYPYRKAELKVRNSDIDTLVSGVLDSEINSRIKTILMVEAPISEPMLTRRLLQSFGITRSGARLQAKLTATYRTLDAIVTQSEGISFYWLPTSSPETYLQIRTEDESGWHREIKDIPVEEIACAVCHTLREQFSLFTADLIVESAKLLGFTRPGAAAVKSINEAIKLAMDNGRIIQAANGAWMIADTD